MPKTMAFYYFKHSNPKNACLKQNREALAKWGMYGKQPIDVSFSHRYFFLLLESIHISSGKDERGVWAEKVGALGPFIIPWAISLNFFFLFVPTICLNHRKLEKVQKDNMKATLF